MNHWTENYITRQYVDEHYNCAHAVVDALREVFNKDISTTLIPDASLSTDRERMAAIDAHKPQLEITDNPEEGDICLMYVRGIPCHVGLVWFNEGELMVMHGLSQKKGIVNSSIPVLERFGMTVENYYKVKNNG